ncbi:MAG: D-Ala-D-Ala carboxypeptidase family metallohydrolase, partial [Pseudomonadota bacterium]
FALNLLCHEVLEKVRAEFGPVTVTSGFRSPAVNRAVEGRSGDLLLALATVTFTLERAGYWSAVAQGLWPAQEPADPPRERFADYAATGTLDEEGRVGAVGGAAVKVDAAINKLPPGGLVFYPRAN